MAQAASALMPLTVLQAAALTAGNSAQNVMAPGPIHHQTQVGRFRYSPIGSALNTNLKNPNLKNPVLAGGISTISLSTIATRKNYCFFPLASNGVCN